MLVSKFSSILTVFQKIIEIIVKLHKDVSLLKSVGKQNTVTLYFKLFLLQCNYTFKYWVILINYMYLIYD